MEDINREGDLVIREKNAVIDIAPLPTIEGNFLRLRQLFTNLVSNALKYSKSGTQPRIQVRCQLSDSKVTISVQDNRSEEHMSELQSLMRISYAFFCL